MTSDSSFHRPPACGDLCRAEKLLVRGLRRWLRGGADWDRAVAEASRTMKPAHAFAFANGLNGLAEALDGGARRNLRLRFPSCPRVSADERSVLMLVAAVQYGRYDHAEALVRYLTTPPFQGTAKAHALSVARALEKSGFRLLAPRTARPPRAAAGPALRAIA